MKFCVAIALLLGLAGVMPPTNLASEAASRGRIDELIAGKLKQADTVPNPPVSDEVFLRRIYLDVAGRIPTLEENRRFLDSASGNERAELIDELLASEAAVSHDFNFWADILRISEQVGNMRLVTYGYSMWLKDALRRNMPYDEMVRQMVGARGFIWENGATGYYHRDRGMPLDNMSNTVRIFLGTRLECAQCHDHPFDKWTQMDYYRMAAFSYSMDARLYAPTGRLAIAGYQNEFLAEANARAPGGRVEAGSPDYLRYRGINQVNADLFAFMKFVNTRVTPQTLTLPHDYQYSDAAPEDPVAPMTMFGGEIKAESPEAFVDAYAEWMTSADNPRFAMVIANRLWKRAMGRGLVEPDDEFMDHTAASAANPELLAYLSQRIVDVDFDVRAVRREIFQSRAYQSAATEHEVEAGEVYHFPGPLLRRLSSEQLWDSMVTLAIPDPDLYMPQVNLRLAQLDRLRQVHESFESREVEELVSLAKEYADLYAESYQEIERLNEEFNAAVAAKEEEKIAELRKKLGEIRGQQTSFVRKVAHGDRVDNGKPQPLYATFGIGGELLPLEDIQMSLPRPESKPGSDAQFTEWQAHARDLMRASELELPAPRGHFLREFGQSDREIIQNSSLAGSVPQALSLLNGPFAEILANPNAAVQIGLAAAETQREKVDTLLLATLSREPTEAESTLFLGEIELRGDAAYEDILWVLLNSQRFRFVN